MKTHMKILACSVMALLFGSAAMVSAVDVKLEYERYPDGQQRRYRPHGHMPVQFQTAKPAGEWVLPELRKPLYGFARFADGDRLCVFDMADEASKFFDRVYFDENANKDLTDDAALDGAVTIRDYGRNTFAQVEFPGVDTTVVIDGTALPFSFRVDASGQRLNQFDVATATQRDLKRHCHFSLRPNCCYSGILTNAAGTVRLTLADRNCNGRFTDPLKIQDPFRQDQEIHKFYTEGDALYVSQGDKVEYRESEALPHWLVIRDELYALKIDQVAGRLTLTPLVEGTASMRLPKGVTRLAIHTKGEPRSVVAIDPGVSVKLPPGDYRLLDYQMTKETAEGCKWTVQATGTRLGEYVNVTVGGNAQMTLGEPYTPVVSIPLRSRKRALTQKSARLQFSVTGAGGEMISDLSRDWGKTGTAVAMSARYKHRPKEPSYKILSKDGEVVAQGNFEYG